MESKFLTSFIFHFWAPAAHRATQIAKNKQLKVETSETTRE